MKKVQCTPRALSPSSSRAVFFDDGPSSNVRAMSLDPAAWACTGTMLTSMSTGEPVCLWLPEAYKKPGTSTYVQGVEVPVDYNGPVPEGFDVIRLSAAEYLMFQGEPFREEDYCEAIMAVQRAADKYDPAVIGYQWDAENPRIQLEPRGERGYIELRAVKKSV